MDRKLCHKSGLFRPRINLTLRFSEVNGRGILTMAANSAEIAHPFTLEEAQVCKFTSGLTVDIVHERTETQTRLFAGPTRDDCVYLFIRCPPSYWAIQLVCPRPALINYRSKEKSTLSGAVTALLIAIPASISFAYSTSWAWLI
jgi:hypothetical protein